jgi:hypothetical protein
MNPRPNGQRSLREAAKQGRPATPIQPTPTPPLQEEKPPVCQKCIKRAETDRRLAAEQAEARKRQQEGNTSRQRKRRARQEKKDAERAAVGKGRLPHESQFKLVYNAADEQWTGWLLIGNHVEMATTSAVMDLLPKLDQQYRAWLQQQGKSDA